MTGMTHNDCVWFRENSAARAALGRVQELANEWATAGGVHRRNAYLIRELIDGLVTEQSPPPPSCTACDYGYPASACSRNCDCGAC